jgi:hypothetical protein
MYMGPLIEGQSRKATAKTGYQNIYTPGHVSVSNQDIANGKLRTKKSNQTKLKWV